VIRDRDAEQAQARELAKLDDRELARPIACGGPGREDAIGEVARRSLDQELLFCGLEVH
jgi:hypothetical protein